MNNYDYDAIVIGGGSAGLTASGLAAHFGAKTMLIEKDRLGGDCTWTGCVPSKTLLKAGKIAQQIRKAGTYGLIDQEPEIHYGKVIEHVHKRRREIYEEADRPEIYKEMGIEVVSGTARFLDQRYISIRLKNGGRRKVSARYFFICAGSSASVPTVDGINDTPYLTSESLFEHEERPRELIIMGAGPVGIEMGQAMNRLGSEVTVVEESGRILRKDDSELAENLRDLLEREGLAFELEAKIKKVQKAEGTIALTIESGDEQKIIEGDQLLVAAGRHANVEGLGLESAGIEYSSGGITVNDKCRTNRSHIYACGDITGRYQLTHMSEHMAKVAVTVALTKYPLTLDADHVPWVTFTDPELGHVGATEKQLKEQGTSYETYRFPYSKIDRAVIDSRGEALITIHAKKWSGSNYGVSILGAHAGELISEYVTAMKNGVTLRNIADTIHPYPSYGLGARRAADQWYIKHQSEWQARLLKKLFGYRGKLPDV